MWLSTLVIKNKYFVIYVSVLLSVNSVLFCWVGCFFVFLLFLWGFISNLSFELICCDIIKGNLEK